MKEESKAKPVGSLKSQNAITLKLFIVCNIAIFLSIILKLKAQFALSSVEHYYQIISEKNGGMMVLCLPAIAIILNGILGDTAKARLVFWKWRDPLPGSRAFSRIILKDQRIDRNSMGRKISPFPIEAHEQNAIWYHIYKIHADKITVMESHKTYLLTRDMTALSALFLIIFASGAVISPVGWKVVIPYYLFLILQYFAISASARNYGERFVANVLVEESHA